MIVVAAFSKIALPHILERLLRLRQIAIHPTLVEKNYRGEAPKFEILFETLETLQVENHIGQDKPVFVYKIIARDTVDEKILQIKEKKRALVKSIIATGASFFQSLTKDDVKSLFS